MPPVSLNVKQQIINLIKRFRFEELELAVLPIFPEFSWKDIKSQLVENHESLTTIRAVKIIEDEIDKAKISHSNLVDRQAYLEVIDASRHSIRRFWYTLELKGKNPPKSINTDNLEEKIESFFTAQGLEMSATAVSHNGLIFVSIKEKPKKKERKTIMPVFFSLVPKEKFFFSCRKVIANNLIMSVVEALGFQSYKNVKLDGRNIPSLVRMLRARKTVEEAGGFLVSTVRFKKTAPVENLHGLDFTQHKQRKEFAENYFGDNPPIFETLTVISNDEKWNHPEARNNLPNEIIHSGIRFRSPNIANFLKELITEKVLETPLPCYAANILSLGRNHVNIRKVDRNQQ